MIESEIKVFEDRIAAGEWRVEYFDDDGGCCVTISAGPRQSRAPGTTAMHSKRGQKRKDRDPSA
jgi:hypothetical protein